MPSPSSATSATAPEPAPVAVADEAAAAAAATAVEVKIESISLPAKVDDVPKASASANGSGVKRQCGVCTEQQAKYKCSRCEMPYCSVACSAYHRVTPCEAPPKAPVVVPAEPQPVVQAARPGTVANAGNNIFSVLEHSQKLPQLLAMYPDLRRRLRDIYNATLPPSEPESTYGSDGSNHVFQYGRETKVLPWNNDRGTQEGIDRLSHAKLEYGRGGEAVREFSNLVLKLVAADGVDVAQLVQDEITGENAKIINQLLSGDSY